MCCCHVGFSSKMFRKCYKHCLSLRQAIHYPICHARVVIICLLVLSVQVVKGLHPSHYFSIPSFDNPSLSNVIFVGQNSWYGGQSAAHGSNDSIWLNPDPSIVQTRSAANIGKMVYKDPITFKSPEYGMSSFSTSFTFSITTTRMYPECGSGMVFFIADYVKAPEKSYGRYLGMVSPMALNAHRFFAIEFDTHISTEFGDVSGSHIGIDVNSLESMAVADTSPSSTNPDYYPELFLYNNYTFTTWVEYNSSASLIQVWMTNSSTSQRPSMACLTLTYDLGNVFNDTMFVGFSATNNVSEDGMEGHAIFSWNFSTYNEPLNHHPKASSGSSKLKLALIGVGVGVIVVVGIVCWAVCFCDWNTKLQNGILSRPPRHPGVVPIPLDHLPSVPQYSLQQLITATNNFGRDNLIGEGGFSFVYKGVLEDGSTVAVKKMKACSRKERRMKEFARELKAISRTQHPNLLQLRGWCSESGEALFVYDYMSRGSLERYIGQAAGAEALPTDTRLKILAGVASALHYLHSGIETKIKILHRDVKAANVLLTDAFEPMLSDFGLARRFVNHMSCLSDAVTMSLAGTNGYIAPEVLSSCKFSEKSDVYAFGVLALELACGRHVTGTLVEWVQDLYLRDHSIEALDSSMRLHMSPLQVKQWKDILLIALICCSHFPKARPNMREISEALNAHLRNSN